MANQPKRPFHTASEPEIKAGRGVGRLLRAHRRDPPRRGASRKRVKAEIWLKSFPQATGASASSPASRKRRRLLEGVPVDVWAMDEGTVFAPYQPVLVIEGIYVEWARVRDGAARPPLPGLRHRHQGRALQAGGGRAPGDLLRRAAHAPGAGADDRAQRLHRRLRRRGGDQVRRADRRRPHGHHPPLARAHVRRHRGGAAGLPRGHRPEGAARGPHRHAAGREVRGDPRGRGARQGPLRGAPRHAVVAARRLLPASSRRCAGSSTCAASSTSRSSPPAASTSTRSCS